MQVVINFRNQAPAPIPVLLTKALIIVLVGQSLNVSRGTNVDPSTTWADAYMPVDGCSVVDFTFFATNNDFFGNNASFATFPAFAEGAGQSPCVGILEGVRNAGYARAYILSVAVGSRTVSTMMSRGMRPNYYAMIERACADAVAAGLTPEVVVYSAHGEADAAAGTTKANYILYGTQYYKGLQLAAAQYMGDPTYVAPVLLTYPVQHNATAGNTGQNDREIHEGIRQIAAALPGALDCGPIYQWPCETDRVHPTPASYVLRGEWIGKILADLKAHTEYEALQMTGVTLAGTTFVATFSHNIVRDATLGVGTNLNTANALDGFEWLDNGAFVKINSIIYSGNTATGTLNATPSGSHAQQVLRIASQYTSSSLTAGVTNLAGSLVRKNNAGWVSVVDPTYHHYDWAIPQSVTPP